MGDNFLKDSRLTVYAFQIIDSIAQKTHKVLPPADNLWIKCAELANILEVAELSCFPDKFDRVKKILPETAKSPITSYLELLSEPYSETFSGNKLIVEAYPVQLQDTYFLDLTLRFNEENLVEKITIENLSELNPKGCLLPQSLQSSLGQSLLLITQPNFTVKDYQSLADDCVAALLKEAGNYYSCLLEEAKLICQSGQLFGSPIFEYEPVGREVADLHDRCHIIVWFHCFPQTRKKEIELYKWLLLLLCSRHKIIYAFYESRYCQQEAFQIYHQIELKIAEFEQLPADRNQRLEHLSDLLKEIPKLALDYAKILRDIKDYYSSIDTNTRNYDRYFKVLQTNKLLGDNLTFWQEFSSNECQQFKNQLQVDINYLLPGENLFDRVIGTIRGIVEIEQAESDRDRQAEEKKSDRQWQTTIACIGVGIGVASVTATSFSYHQQPEYLPRSIQVFPDNSSSSERIIKSISISVTVGLLAAIGTWGLIYLWRLLVQPQLVKLKMKK